MAIGNILRGIFNGVKSVAENIPGVGDAVKQGEATLGQIGNVGDNLFTTKDNTPSTYNTQAENVQQGESGDSRLGNFMSPRPQAQEGAEAAKEGESAANAAKNVKAAEQAAVEIAEML